ncbi:MAG: glycosyltransferase family 4 protein [Gluconacetobacter diazotrophicus]|nr:glycosyltransferase family 4 protein [Gluconacetobacter diazotrophicus]
MAVAPDRMMPDRVMVVLPPGEGFSAEAVGAVGLQVFRLSDRGELVVGRAPGAAPFAERRFRAVPDGVGLPMGRRLGYVAGVARLVREERPRLLEVHNRPELAAMLRRRFPRLPMLLVLHNDPRAMRRAARPAARERLARRMGVATVSPWLRERFVGGLSPETAGRVAVLPNCLDLRALPEPAGVGKRDDRILFAGRITADKGADGFVRGCALALPHLPAGWRANMIGGDRFRDGVADTAFMRELRPDAERAGIAMAGYEPHRAVLDAMARTAVVVVPSRWEEPFGLAALEAMASGAVLLCSRRGGLAALTDGVALTVDPDRPEEMAATLRRVAADPELRADLGRRGRERARTYDLPAARARLDVLRATVIATGTTAAGAT